MSSFLNIADVYFNNFASHASESQVNRFAVRIEVHFGDSIAHEPPYRVRIIETEPYLRNSVEVAQGKKSISHYDSHNAHGVLESGIFDFPRYKLPLLAIFRVENSHGLHFAFWLVELHLVEGLVVSGG